MKKIAIDAMGGDNAPKAIVNSQILRFNFMEMKQKLRNI